MEFIAGILGMWIAGYMVTTLIGMDSWYKSVSKRFVRSTFRGLVTKPLRKLTRWLWTEAKYLYRTYPLQFIAFLAGFSTTIWIASLLSR